MDRAKGAPLTKSLASNGLRLLGATLLAVCLTAFLMVLEKWNQRNPSGMEGMRLFQREIGGLGMGAAAAPAWNILHYDPRLQSVDDSNLGPIPGSYPYSPAAVSAVVSIKELPREDLMIVRIE